jgi:hypothetical protein
LHHRGESRDFTAEIAEDAEENAERDRGRVFSRSFGALDAILGSLHFSPSSVFLSAFSAISVVKPLPSIR